MSEETAAWLLPLFLETFVPVRIAHYERLGGPSDYDVGRARDFWLAAIDAGETTELYFVTRPTKGSKKKPASTTSTARSAGMLAELLACLAFNPGGVEIFGQKFVGYRGGIDAAQAMRQVPENQAVQ